MSDNLEISEVNESLVKHENNITKQGPKDVDEALSIVGGYRPWHMTTFILLAISSFMPICLQSLSIVFIGWEPPHHCKVPEGAHVNETIPQETGQDGQLKWDTCSEYRNITVNNATRPCTEGWEYHSQGYTSIVTEFDLVCGYNFLAELSQFLYQIAATISDCACAFMADKYGRKRVHIGVLLSVSCIGLGIAFSPNYLCFVILRMLVGSLAISALNSGLTFIMEMFDTKHRTFAGISLEFGWVLIYMGPVITGYLFLSWRTQQIVNSVISFVWIMYIWLLPETVPWLVAYGRYEEAEEVLLWMAKMNRLKINKPIILKRKKEHEFIYNVSTKEDIQSSPAANGKNIFEQTTKSVTKEEMINLKNSKGDYEKVKEANKELMENHVECNHSTYPESIKQNKPKKVPLSKLFTDPKLRLHLIMSNLFWFTNAVIYYGLILASPQFGPNRFLNFFLMGIIEIPVYIVTLFILARVGRRWPLCIYYLIAGIPFLIVIFVPSTTSSGRSMQPLILFLMLVAKFGITGSFAVMLVYIRELFPASLRSSCIAWCSVAGGIGNSIAPFAAYAAKRIFWLPNLLFAIFSLAAALCIIPLPETGSLPLPVTIEDVYTTLYNTDYDQHHSSKKQASDKTDNRAKTRL